MSASFKILANLLKVARTPIYFAIYAPWYGLYKCGDKEYTSDEELLRDLKAEVQPEVNGKPFHYIPDFILYENSRFPSQKDINRGQEVKTQCSARSVELFRSHYNILDRLALFTFRDEYMKHFYIYTEFMKTTGDFQLKVPKFQYSLTDKDGKLTQVQSMYATMHATKEQIKELAIKNPLFEYIVQLSENNLGFITKAEPNDFIHHIPGLCIASCKSSSNDSWSGDAAIVALNDSNFKEYLFQEKVVVVLFYAPWCTACQEMKPVFMEVARELKAEGWESTAAMIDCSVNFDMAYRYGIAVFPTIKIFRYGRFMQDYIGARSKDQLKAFAIQYCRKR